MKGNEGGREGRKRAKEEKMKREEGIGGRKRHRKNGETGDKGMGEIEIKKKSLMQDPTEAGSRTK